MVGCFPDGADAKLAANISGAASGLGLSWRGNRRKRKRRRERKSCR